MINKLKKTLYFPIATYFKFFAQIQLARWKPRIIVITGSSGKTTLLNLIKSQLQGKAKYSHFANSAYGIPFNILGLSRKKLTLDEWPYLFLAAPFRAFKKPRLEKLYVVEADCDRPYEGKFLADLLKPEVTLWTGVGRTHSMNFDYLVKNHKFPSVDEAIAYEFGYFLEYASSLVIVNRDSNLITKQAQRSKAAIKGITQKDLNSYKIFKDHTLFEVKAKKYIINDLLPKEAAYSLQMTLALLEYLKIKPDPTFSKLSLTPGRCSLIKGIKNTTIIDSSYNATPDGMRAILNMFSFYPSNNKWVVLGDMIELGDEEKVEHEKLADIINLIKLNKIILVGPRLSKYTYPKLKTLFKCHPELGSGSLSSEFEMPKLIRQAQSLSDNRRQVRHDIAIETLLMPKEALDYIKNNIKGGEVLLFKGARFLEGIIEHLLQDKNDINKLVRREKIWQERRKKWGL